MPEKATRIKKRPEQHLIGHLVNRELVLRLGSNSGSQPSQKKGKKVKEMEIQDGNRKVKHETFIKYDKFSCSLALIYDFCRVA